MTMASSGDTKLPRPTEISDISKLGSETAVRFSMLSVVAAATDSVIGALKRALVTEMARWRRGPVAIQAATDNLEIDTRFGR